MEEESKIVKDFKINEFLSVKLKDDETIIFVKNVEFKQCKYLLINIPVEESEDYDEINSIDEAIELSRKKRRGRIGENFVIDPETEFWGHCSNLQAWVESGYDSRLLHSNLAFPLLKKLTEKGDFRAKIAFKEEIAKRVESGHLPVFRFILRLGFLDYLNEEEIEPLLESRMFPTFWKKLGIYFLRNGYFNKAFKVFIRALELGLEEDSIWTYLGILYMEKGKFNVAIKLFKRAMIINANDMKIWVYLSEIYFFKGEFEKSERMVKFARSIVENREDLESAWDFMYDVRHKMQIREWDKKYKMKKSGLTRVPIHREHDINRFRAKKTIKSLEKSSYWFKQRNTEKRSPFLS